MKALIDVVSKGNVGNATGNCYTTALSFTCLPVHKT